MLIKWNHVGAFRETKITLKSRKHFHHSPKIVRCAARNEASFVRIIANQRTFKFVIKNSTRVYLNEVLKNEVNLIFIK